MSWDEDPPLGRAGRCPVVELNQCSRCVCVDLECRCFPGTWGDVPGVRETLLPEDIRETSEPSPRTS